MSRTRFLLALTFVTGVVDAVSFLALGQVFSAMQTGNVAFLGFGIAAADGAPAPLGPLVALAAFLAGGVTAAVIADRRRAPLADLRLAVTVEVLLLSAAALLAALVTVEPEHLVAYALIALLSLTMGLRNTLVRGLGGSNLATTVLNLTVTAIATHTPISIASGTDLSLRLAALSCLLGGAIAGALLVRSSAAAAIGVAAALTLVAGVTHLGRAPTPERA